MKTMKKIKTELLFQTKGTDKIYTLLRDKKPKIINFLNAYSIYLWNTNKLFKQAVTQKNNFNFPDGVGISLIHFAKKGNLLKRICGPDATQNILALIKNNKTHLFIGAKQSDIENIRKKFKNISSKNIFYYNPPYIKGLEFDEQNINEMSELITNKKIDYIWVGVGNPKQEILSGALLQKTGRGIYFNVGQALDIITRKKKRAPKWIRKFGAEWLYRLIKDFKYVWKKVFYSFLIGCLLPFYIKKIRFEK